MTIPGQVIVALAIVGWIFTLILVQAAAQKPRIAPLTERAFVGVVISSFALLYGLVASNSDAGFLWFDSVAARALIRLGAAIVCCVPIAWGLAYLSGRLGSKS